MIENKVVFNISGGIIPMDGSIPNYFRYSRAFLPYVEGGSIWLKEATVHEPRYGSNGSLLLEPATVNLLRSPIQLEQPYWQYGDAVFIQPDITGSMSRNLVAEVLTFAAWNGITNIDTQVLRQSLYLEEGIYTLSIYLRSVGRNTFGERDVISVKRSGGEELISYQLNRIFTEDRGSRDKNVRISLTFIVTARGLHDIELQCLTSQTIYWLGAQLEPLPFPTSLVETTSGVLTRSEDILAYEKSPFSGRNNFTYVFYFSDLRGDGNVFTAGNVSASIEGGFFKAKCGTVTVTSKLKISPVDTVVVRAESGSSLKLYVNGILHTSTSLPVFTGSQDNLVFTSGGVRQFQFYVFGEALKDGNPQPIIETTGMPLQIPINQCTAGEEILELRDPLVKLATSRSRGSLSLPTITLTPNMVASVRFPMTRAYSTTVTAVVNADIGVKSQINLIDFSGLPYIAGVKQAVWVQINRNLYSYETQGTATSATAQIEEISRALEAAINTNKEEVVIANFSNGVLEIRAKAKGNPFGIAVSPGLVANLTQPNEVGIGSIKVTNAVAFSPNVKVLHVSRNYQDVCDILYVSKVSNAPIGQHVINCYTVPASLLGLVQPGDVVFESKWSTKIAPVNYFCNHLESIEGIKVIAKYTNGFLLKNETNKTHTITPYINFNF